MSTQTMAMKRRLRRISPRRVGRLTFSYGILLLVTLIILVPIIWLVITSLKTQTEYNAWPIKFLPAEAQWQNYVDVFAPQHRLFRYARNSLILAVSNTVLTIITSSLGGFAFSRFQDVPGRDKLFSVIIALLIIPNLVTVIPQFIIFARLGLTNTYWPWILWGLGASAFFIFMFRQFFLSFPKDLEDAAEVDGCNPFRIYWQIFMPNAKPVLATAFITGFSGVWGDWLNPVIYLTAANTTLAIKIATAYVDPQGHAIVPLTLAASVVYILPLVVMFFLGQKQILQGVVSSGIRG